MAEIDMRLNLGADTFRIKGYVNVDISDKADQQIDLREMPWPWEANSIDEIMASHVIEHLDKADAIRFMKECHRILIPGGQLYIAVPDMDKFIEARLTGRWDDIVGSYSWRDLNNFMGGDETEIRPGWRHRYMYSFESLAFCLSTYCGFAVHRRGPMDIDNQNHAKFSLYVTAEKVAE